MNRKLPVSVYVFLVIAPGLIGALGLIGFVIGIVPEDELTRGLIIESLGALVTAAMVAFFEEQISEDTTSSELAEIKAELVALKKLLAEED
jgi:hypothetical protein